MKIVQRIMTEIFTLAALSIGPICLAQAPGDGGTAFMAGANAVLMNSSDRTQPRKPLSPEEQREEIDLVKRIVMPIAVGGGIAFLGIAALLIHKDRREIRRQNHPAPTLKL
jgi:hypothetical protein